MQCTTLLGLGSYILILRARRVDKGVTDVLLLYYDVLARVLVLRRVLELLTRLTC